MLRPDDSKKYRLDGYQPIQHLSILEEEAK
jgi:hypothetical protein